MRLRIVPTISRPVEVRAEKIIPAPTVWPDGYRTPWPSASAELPSIAIPYAVTASSRSTPNATLRPPAREPAGKETVMRSYCCALASPTPGIANFAVTPAGAVNGKPCCQSSGGAGAGRPPHGRGGDTRAAGRGPQPGGGGVGGGPAGGRGGGVGGAGEFLGEEGGGL